MAHAVRSEWTEWRVHRLRLRLRRNGTSQSTTIDSRFTYTAVLRSTSRALSETSSNQYIRERRTVTTRAQPSKKYMLKGDICLRGPWEDRVVSSEWCGRCGVVGVVWLEAM